MIHTRSRDSESSLPEKVSAVIRSLLANIAILSAAVALLGVAAPAAAQSEEPIDLIAIDADIAGNDATSLGALDGCQSVAPGDTATVDVIVDAIPDDRPTVGFQIEVTYDPAILEAIDFDNTFLLASKDAYQPIEGLSDALPDNDGNLLIIVADAASDVLQDVSVESGEGVLSRVTFRALSAGTSTVGLGFDPPDVYPSIIDPLNTAIQVDNIGSVQIVVGGECNSGVEAEITALPPLSDLQPTPGPTPIPPQPVETESELNVTFLVIAAVLGAVGIGGLGGGWWLILSRRVRR